MFIEPEHKYDFAVDYTPAYKLNVLVSPALSIILGLKESFLISVLNNLCKYAKETENTAFLQEGRWWCRASCKELSIHYPFLGTNEEIQQLIEKLDEKFYLLTEGHYCIDFPAFLESDNVKWVTPHTWMLNEEILAFYKYKTAA